MNISHTTPSTEFIVLCFKRRRMIVFYGEGKYVEFRGYYTFLGKKKKPEIEIYHGNGTIEQFLKESKDLRRPHFRNRLNFSSLEEISLSKQLKPYQKEQILNVLV